MADVLKVEESLRLKLTRNGNQLYNQQPSSVPEAYTRHASDRVVLAANMGAFQQVNLGDIGVSLPGQHMMVVADRAITIAVNTTAQAVVADTLVMVGASITALYLKNTDATNTATVEFVVTD